MMGSCNGILALVAVASTTEGRQLNAYTKANVCSAGDTSGYHAEYVKETTGYGAALLSCLCTNTSMFDNGPYTDQ